MFLGVPTGRRRAALPLVTGGLGWAANTFSRSASRHLIDIVSGKPPWALDRRLTTGSTLGPGEVGRQILAGYEQGSVRALLHAACSSPGAVHHLPLLADLLAQSYAFAPRGLRTAGRDDLPRWVNLVRAEVPGVTVRDDWIPCDPRLLVRAMVSERRRPVHPGLLTRPQDLLPTVMEYAECVDPVLLDGMGFGLSDVAELAMRIMEVEREVLAPAWTGERPTDPADPVRVSLAEMQAVQGLLAAWRRCDDVGGVLDVLRAPGGLVYPGRA